VRSPLDSYLFSRPAHPSCLYALNQGIHVSLGLALIPAILVRQWSVLPRFFRWPPFRSPAQDLSELLSIARLGRRSPTRPTSSVIPPSRALSG
jgi:hypothetical protein